MKASAFVTALSSIRLDAVFNPYSDRCDIWDRIDAPRRRRANLRAFLEVGLSTDVDSVWIARDLGYRGGRRTGLPLTDEEHLADFSKTYGGLSLSRATTGPLVSERTASIIWQVLTQLDQVVFLWNIFPLHPFKLNDPLSNRRHTRAERRSCQDLFFTLLDMIQAPRLVAIGRDAQNALTELGLEHHAVRHPSYGGQTEFVLGMAKLYGLPSASTGSHGPSSGSVSHSCTDRK